MRCCRCSEEMLIIEYAHIEIDYCPDCGIWLDSGELELVLEEAGGSRESGSSGTAGEAANTDDKPVKCPICRTRMEKERYDEISSSIVDRCPREHGIWLDRGELREIIQTHTKGDGARGTAVTTRPPRCGDSRRGRARSGLIRRSDRG